MNVWLFELLIYVFFINGHSTLQKKDAPHKSDEVSYDKGTSQNNLVATFCLPSQANWNFEKIKTSMKFENVDLKCISIITVIKQNH